MSNTNNPHLSGKRVFILARHRDPVICSRQVAACATYAADHNSAVVGVAVIHRNEKVHDTIEDLVARQNLVRDVDVLLIYDISRLTRRGVREFQLLLLKLVKAGIDIALVDRNDHGRR